MVGFVVGKACRQSEVKRAVGGIQHNSRNRSAQTAGLSSVSSSQLHGVVHGDEYRQALAAASVLGGGRNGEAVYTSGGQFTRDGVVGLIVGQFIGRHLTEVKRAVGNRQRDGLDGGAEAERLRGVGSRQFHGVVYGDVDGSGVGTAVVIGTRYREGGVSLRLNCDGGGIAGLVCPHIAGSTSSGQVHGSAQTDLCGFTIGDDHVGKFVHHDAASSGSGSGTAVTIGVVHGHGLGAVVGPAQGEGVARGFAGYSGIRLRISPDVVVNAVVSIGCSGGEGDGVAFADSVVAAEGDNRQRVNLYGSASAVDALVSIGYRNGNRVFTSGSSREGDGVAFNRLQRVV